MARTVRFTVSLTPDERTQLEAAAQSLGMDGSNLLRQALYQHEAFQRVLQNGRDVVVPE